MVFQPHQGRRRRAICFPDANAGIAGWASYRCTSRRSGGRFPCAEKSRRPCISDHTKLVHSVVLGEDDAILKSQKALWQVLRVVAEPGGAAAFSALLSGAYTPQPGERVGVIISGGNTAVVNFEQ